jgi:CobQ-like glutamine amidotransferase family enzyme
MSKKTLNILHLYPRDMNIYGDWGNVLVLKKRAEWHGYAPKIIDYNPGDVFPKNIDIVVGGGGQDSGQDKIQADLLKIGPKLRALANDNVPMLVICGLYQLFGKYFQTYDKRIIKGIGILDIETIAETERLIGNTIIHSEDFGEIIGYENHSGKTYIGDLKNLGTVVRGAGNNGDDKTEGARYHNVIGSYLHGSLLPKNPRIADWLIKQAATKKYGSFTHGKIDDRFAELAREYAIKRPR